MNTDALRSNYEAIAEIATSGEFGPPPPDEWTAEQIIAHLTANDDLLAATTVDVLAGRPTAYDNTLAIDTARLSALVDECAGRDGVIQRLRTTSTRLAELVEQIDDDQAATTLHVHILDGTIVQVDQPLPLAALFRAQAMVHLPAHLQQLENLLR
jgi:DinB superfamily